MCADLWYESVAGVLPTCPAAEPVEDSAADTARARPRCCAPLLRVELCQYALHGREHRPLQQPQVGVFAPVKIEKRKLCEHRPCLGRGQRPGIQSSAVFKGLCRGIRFNDLAFNLLRPVEPGLNLLGMGRRVGQCQGRLLQKRSLGAGDPANGCNGPCIRDGDRNKKAECCEAAGCTRAGTADHEVGKDGHIRHSI